MKFSSNSSSVGRIIDTLSYNRVTDFEAEAMTPFMRKTMGGTTTAFRNSMKSLDSNKQFNTYSNENPNDSRSQNSSFVKFKSKSKPLKLNPLAMSQQLRSTTLPINGRDIRPDLHRKTYFKAQATVQIQNSPRIKLPSTTKLYGMGKSSRVLKNNSSLLQNEMREGMQAYNTEQ